MVIRNMSCCISATVLLSIFCSLAQANPSSGRWVCVDTLAPARSHFKCTFHQRRGSIFLFGGRDSSGQFPDSVMEWRNNLWSTLDFTGPSGRIDFGMYYNYPQNDVVLFGGQDSSGVYLGDTWVLSDSGWSQLNIQGPSPRSGFCVTDNSYQNMIIFGGTDGQDCFGDTWKFDGTNWIHLSDEGPLPRTFGTMGTDGYADGYILFGGLAGCRDSALNDAWRWNGSIWIHLQPVYMTPEARFGHMMGLDGFLGTIMFGGQDNDLPQNYFNDTFDTYSYPDSFCYWGPLNSGLLPARSFGDMATYFVEPVLIGGTNGSQTFHDMWQFRADNYRTYHPGDVNGNGVINSTDVVYFVNYLKGGPAPPTNMHVACPLLPDPFYAAADVNGNCQVNGIDITFFVRYLKGEIPRLLYCSICPP